MLTALDLDQMLTDLSVARQRTCCRECVDWAIGLALGSYAEALLSAAEALLRIKDIARDETDLGDFSKRVGAVLDEWERG
jgi:hypothetical protein